MPDASAHKRLLLLGLLRDQARHGYELNRIIEAHGVLYADLKRGNTYYLLERLAADGFVATGAEPGERRVYRLTEAGAAEFDRLLEQVMLAFDAVHTGIDVAVTLLASRPAAEAVELLGRRRAVVTVRRRTAEAELYAAGSTVSPSPLVRLAADHLLTLMDAELAWIDRALTELTKAE